MRLYSGPLSLFTAKVRIALDEKGLPYERVEVGWSLAHRYEPHHPDVVELNPKRQVPVLVDGDLVAYDSTLILEYLEDRYPEPPLYPREVAARARCRRLEAAADEILFPPLWDLIEESFYPVPGGSRNRERLDRAQTTFARLLAGVDDELEGRDYLCGAFSVADVATFVMVHAATSLGAPVDPRLEALATWLARMRARPAVHREIESMGRFVAGLLPASPSEQAPPAGAVAGS
jgi:glutathione S-transferase